MTAFVRRAGDILRDMLRIWWLAPIILLIAVIPEFVQHIAEIRMGMFESIEQAKAISNDPTRWIFGYAKLTGYLVAVLAAMRFWAAHERGERWWSPKGVAWKVFGLALIGNAVVILIAEGIDRALGGASEMVNEAGSLGWTLLTAPFLIWLIAGLVGDRGATLKGAYKTGWFAILRIVAYSAMVLVPLMWLHSLNHRWAIGASEPVVWGLMVFDSLVVGLLAAGWGTAIHHGYKPLRTIEEGGSR